MFVAKLLYSSLCPSVCNANSGNVIFSAAFKLIDKMVKLSVKISKTYAHLVYILFCPSVCQSCFETLVPTTKLIRKKITKPIRDYQLS